MKKFVCFFIVMIGCAMVFQTPGYAQQTNMVLNFEGKNAQTGAAVQLESVFIKNLTKNCDTTLYGATPYLYLTWPSSIDELMGGKKSGFSISPNYPNPFASSTSFELTVLERSSIIIKLLDVYGAVHATFQQELDWGLHTFEVFTAKNSIYFITADNGITSRTIKLVSIGSTDNQKQTIRYRGIENLKAGSDINTFAFSPGDQLMMKGTAAGFYDKTMFHNPTENTSYTFELEPASGEPPVADFTATPTSGTAPLTVNFTDQSTNNPTSWAWDFGDGNTSTQQNPQHTYQDAGSYTVQLTVSNSFGSDTETKTDYIQGNQTGYAPVAAFTANPTSGTAPLTVNFTDQSTNNPTSWAWDLGDGNTSTEQNPQHTYQDAGSYTVQLTVSNSFGSDTETKTDYIQVNQTGYAPVAAFIANPTSGTAPLTVNFTDQSTNDPTGWLWDFGDGSTSTQQNPQHIYQDAGSYTVQMTASNSFGSDTETKTDYIQVNQTGSAPVAAFTGSPTSGTAPLTVNFTDQSTNNPTSWQWNFGDGITSTQQNPQHTYQNAGDYTVQLTVTNSHGSDTEIKTNYIAVTTGGGTGQPCPGTPTVTDIDGNVYNTVLIGDQCWMAENLNTTRDAAGNNITRYCNDNNTTNCDLYGGLYNWATVMNGAGSSNNNPSGVQGICPTGWHVPSDAEWTQLVDYVVSQGYPNNWNDPNGTGNALKSCRQVNSPLGGNCNTTEHPRWNSHVTHHGFDEFGFSAFPGGNRDTNGTFFGLGYGGVWWSSTEGASATYAWGRHMHYTDGDVGRSNGNKTGGFGARCLRDN
jgi:uncharacterized protein (TIGR02145 family)